MRYNHIGNSLTLWRVYRDIHAMVRLYNAGNSGGVSGDRFYQNIHTRQGGMTMDNKTLQQIGKMDTGIVLITLFVRIAEIYLSPELSLIHI